EPQKLLHIPPLGPTYIPDWVVDTLLFILRVVPSRTVRSRQPKLQFLLVEGLSRNVHLYSAYHGHDPAVTTDLTSQFNRVVTLCCRGNDHGVNPSPASEVRDSRSDVVRTGDCYVGTKLSR